MTQDALERELRTLGWEPVVQNVVNSMTGKRTPTLYAWYPPATWIYLGVLDLVLTNDLKTFRQRNIYKRLTGEVH